MSCLEMLNACRPTSLCFSILDVLYVSVSASGWVSVLWYVTHVHQSVFCAGGLLSRGIAQLTTQLMHGLHTLSGPSPYGVRAVCVRACGCGRLGDCVCNTVSYCSPCRDTLASKCPTLTVTIQL